MPVGYGERYFRVALGSFLSQVYDDLELVVLDNSGESIEPLLPHDSRIKYFHCPRMPVGALRNLGTRYATGEICITWDEDVARINVGEMVKKSAVVWRFSPQAA